MTVLVDTSAWVEFLRGTGSPVDAAVTDHLRARSAATTDAVLLEVLSGAGDERKAARLHALLLACVLLPQEPLADAEAASALHRACRRQGETPRSRLNCLVAAVAIRHDVPVLHRDRDFDVIARHTALEVVPL